MIEEQHITLVGEVSPAALICLAAIMTAQADTLLNAPPLYPHTDVPGSASRPGRRWTMFLYDQMHKHEIDITWIYRLERSINRELKKYGHPEVKFGQQA